jgi:hypothetical protein
VYPRDSAASSTPRPASPSWRGAGAPSVNGTTGARLARAFLGYLLGVVVIVTLVPFDFGMPASFHLSWKADLADAVANVGMFIPLGFLAQLTLTVEDPLARRPLLLGLALSAAVEAGAAVPAQPLPLALRRVHQRARRVARGGSAQAHSGAASRSRRP